MEWCKVLLDSLPQPRNDEPPSLRQDIADELSDHLQSALRRQLVITPDADLAQAQVLDRFGNPQQIARQLWFDALKEKIMSQRVVLTVTALLALASFGAMGMTWRVVALSQAATESLVEQSRSANEALLDRLANLTARPAVEAGPVRSVIWNPVHVHVVLGTKDGPPAKGFTVQLRRKVSNTAPSAVMGGMGGGMGGMGVNPNADLLSEERTGPDGMADMGLVPPGKYLVSVRTEAQHPSRYPWAEFLSQSLSVAPGSSETVEIIAPPSHPASVDVSIRTEWPEDLQNQGLAVRLTFAQDRRDFGGGKWAMSWDGTQALDFDRTADITPDGQIGTQFPGMHMGPGKTRFAATTQFANTAYHLKCAEVVIETPPNPGSYGTGYDSLSRHLLYLPTEFAGFSGSMQVWPIPQSIPANELAKLPTFTPEIGRVNEWKIALPDELWKTAREKLAERKAVLAQQAAEKAAAEAEHLEVLKHMMLKREGFKAEN